MREPFRRAILLKWQCCMVAVMVEVVENIFIYYVNKNNPREYKINDIKKNDLKTCLPKECL